MKLFAWAICNMTTVGCLTLLAIHFDKWWIVLFAALLLFSVKDNNADRRGEGEA